MIQYRCSVHNITFHSSECPICHKRGEIDISQIYWCPDCNIPIYEEKCSLCGKNGRKIATDIRPVFPE